MNRGRYYFNRETLQYEKVHVSLRLRLRRALLLTLITGSVVISIRYLIDDNFNSPKLRILNQENQNLQTAYLELNHKLNSAEIILDDIRVRDDHLYRSVFELEPIPSSVREAGFGGSDELSINLESDNSDFVTNTALRLDQLSNKVRIQSGSLFDLYNKAKEQQLLLSNKPSIQPISPSDRVWLTSSFGVRSDPFHKKRRMHHGIDLAGQVGIKIYATGDGVVETAAYTLHGYGNEVVIDHGFNIESIYGHLDKIYVHKGDTVRKGQLIGTLGNTGRSTGPHLHYEIRENNRSVNPMYYFFENLSIPEYSLITAKNQGR